MELLFESAARFLDLFGKNPYAGMWFLFVNGGWAVFLFVFVWAAKEIWINTLQGKAEASKEWILLAVTIPRLTEQTPRAAENIFAHFAGAHSPVGNFLDVWWKGHKQGTITCEIVSIEGHVQFLVRAERKFRDLVEASIYAQYPDAEAIEVEDYTAKIPSRYPDPEWDIFGSEMIPAREDVLPIRTYPEFEDKVSGEFKDPLSVLLENMSRLGPGEQFWYQIVLTPIEQKAYAKKVDAFIRRFLGQPSKTKKGLIETVIELPFRLIGAILSSLATTSPTEKPKGGDLGDLQKRMLTLTPGEKKLLEAVQDKAAKIMYQCKIRFLYVAKHEVMKKPRIIHPFIGAIKQYNTNDLQSLKPSGKVAMNSALLFRNRARNITRQNALIRAYKDRSDWIGHQRFHMNIEELASLWHFPITGQVKAPQLLKTEAKRAEPPMNLPYG